MLQFSPMAAPIHQWLGSDPIVWVVECEVERHWPRYNPANIVGPAIAPRTERQVIGAMEELALLLARPQDLVILRVAPDPDYLAYLQSYGFAHNAILVLRTEDPCQDICELIGHDTALLAMLSQHLQHDRLRFFFYGATAAADRLVRETGIPSVSASHDVTCHVNDKCFSAHLTGLPHAVPSHIVHSPAQLQDRVLMLLRTMSGKILLKDPMGVSGRGIRSIASETELAQYLQYLERRRIAHFTLLVEAFIEKQCDLNYQFFLHRSGRVDYYLYKEALVAGHRHLGHFTPASPDSRVETTCRYASEILGRALANEGYVGVVGVDGLVAQDGTIYPLLEINARLNNSSFQWVLDQVRQWGLSLLASQLAVTLQHRPSFAAFQEQILRALPTGTHDALLIMNWATMSRIQHFPVRTRLLYAVIAPTRDRCRALQQLFEQRVAKYCAQHDFVPSRRCPPAKTAHIAQTE